MTFDESLDVPFQKACDREVAHEGAIEVARAEVESEYLADFASMRATINMEPKYRDYLAEWTVDRIDDGRSFLDGADDVSMSDLTDVQLDVIRTKIREWMREDGFMDMVAEHDDIRRDEGCDR